MLLVACLLLSSVPARESPDRLLTVEVGFSHWFGETFGTVDGLHTPMLSAGARLPGGFLELRGRYSLSVSPLSAPSGGARVGFASLELALVQDFRRGHQLANLAVGAIALATHAGEPGVGAGYGLLLETRYLLETGLSGRLALGPFCALRGVYYALPGEGRNLLKDPRRDAQIDLGLALTFL